MTKWSKKNALGYYVHAKAENYRKFGIGYDSPGISAAEAWNQNHQMLMKTINTKKFIPGAKALENFLNKVAQAGNSNINFEDYGFDKGNAEHIFLDEMKKKYPLYEADFYKLDLNNIGGIENELIQKYKRKWGNKETFFQMKTIEERIRALNIWIDAARKEINSGKVNQNILKKIEKAEEARLQLDIIAATINGRQVKVKTEEEFDFIKTLLNVTSSVAIPKKSDYGFAGEMGLGVIFALMVEDTSKNIDELISNVITGKQKSQRVPIIAGGNFLATNYIMENTLQKDIHGRRNNLHLYETDDNGTIYDVTGSYQTADLTVTLPDGNKLAQEMGINQFQASLKNYEYTGQGAELKIVDGVPLLNALNFLTVDFANHFLNLFASTSVGYPFGVQQTAYTNDLKIAVMIRGLMGVRQAGVINSTPDFFIAHERSNSSFPYRVWNSSELAWNYANKYPHKILLKDGASNFESPKLKNEWVDIEGKNYDMAGAIIRISNLVASTHVYKLSASLIMV